LSEVLLVEFIKNLEKFEGTKKGKKSSIDWGKFRKWEREAERQSERKVKRIKLKESKKKKQTEEDKKIRKNRDDDNDFPPA
jgi:hypothetical protein